MPSRASGHRAKVVAARGQLGRRIAVRIGLFQETDELSRKIRVLAGTYAQNERALAILCDVGMAHGAVQIDTLPGRQRDGRIELQVNLDAPFEDVHKLLPLMPDQVAEFIEWMCPDSRQGRD